MIDTCQSRWGLGGGPQGLCRGKRFVPDPAGWGMASTHGDLRGVPLPGPPSGCKALWRQRIPLRGGTGSAWPGAGGCGVPVPWELWACPCCVGGGFWGGGAMRHPDSASSPTSPFATPPTPGLGAKVGLAGGGADPHWGAEGGSRGPRGGCGVHTCAPRGRKAPRGARPGPPPAICLEKRSETAGAGRGGFALPSGFSLPPPPLPAEGGSGPPPGVAPCRSQPAVTWWGTLGGRNLPPPLPLIQCDQFSQGLSGLTPFGLTPPGPWCDIPSKRGRHPQNLPPAPHQRPTPVALVPGPPAWWLCPGTPSAPGGGLVWLHRGLIPPMPCSVPPFLACVPICGPEDNAGASAAFGAGGEGVMSW